MAILVAFVLLVGCVLSGCSFDRWAKVEPGGYLVTLANAADADARLREDSVCRRQKSCPRVRCLIG